MKGKNIMRVSITIKYNVKNTNNKELNKDIKFEYHKRVYKEDNQKKEEIYSDDIKFERNRILIECNRSKAIDLNNCWKTKRSNFKRCIVSSLFYVYNFYRQPIEIESIIISDHSKNEIDIPFVQEFGAPLPDSFVIDENIEYLFKMISHKEVSDIVYRILHSQVLFTKNKDFYNAYRSFNSMYTFVYTFHNKSAGKGDNDKDLEAIISLLTLDNIEQVLTNSISLSEQFYINNKEELNKLLLVWLINKRVQFKEDIADTFRYNRFKYKNKNVLEVIKRIIEKNYPKSDENRNDKPLKGFETNYKNSDSSSYEINYLQLLILYAQYRRNKLLHGEHVDPTFLISDINADILSCISDIVFQVSIDLINNMDPNDFSEVKIF